jgi:putative glutamine amidotransferase
VGDRDVRDGSRRDGSATAPGRRPLIGVTTSEVRRRESIEQIPQGEEPASFEMALGLTYMRAVEAAGGIPLVMPPLESEAIESLLDRIDGICLSGGPDLDPANYGAEPHPQLGPTEPPLDRFELAVARAADARGMPILAICRGTQALNVARGGTLHQHLPDLSEEIGHRQCNPADQPSHAIEVEPGSRLGAALGADGAAVDGEIAVNSFHHQAIDRLGAGLTIVARAADGTIEAVEDPERDFLIGVQWHAETMVERPYEAGLFRGFVESCRGGVRRPEAAARTG